jgi:hypothetical protein
MRVADHAPQAPAANPGGAISQVLPCRQSARGEAEASHCPHGRALLPGPDGLTSGEQLLLISGGSGSAVDTAASASGHGGAASHTPEEVEMTARMVVRPDEPWGDQTRAQVESDR